MYTVTCIEPKFGTPVSFDMTDKDSALILADCLALAGGFIEVSVRLSYPSAKV